MPGFLMRAFALGLLTGTAFAGLPFSAWQNKPAPGLDRLAAKLDAPAGKPVNLTLATWNVWGLPAGTPERAERIKAIAREVAAHGADIACFQEVFLESDRRALCTILAEAGLRHFRYYASLPFGSGLLTVSRYPIREAAFHRFTRGGNPFAFKHGDWWAGKGVGVATIDIPGFGAIRILNTHLHARYAKDHYRELRKGQLRELTAVVKNSADTGAPTLLLGDLNHRREDPSWAGCLTVQGWQQLSKPWSPIDYILAARESRYAFRHTAGHPLEGSLLDKTEKVRLSDHVGVLAEVTIAPR